MTTSSSKNTGDAFLDLMSRDSRQRASLARALKSEKDLRRQALEMPPPKLPKLRARGFDLIAEVKFRSPSNGDLGRTRNDPQEAQRIAHNYASAGAAMVSILTQPSAFRGSLEHLRRVAQDCPIPVMRKDFLMDTYQVWEARAAGADCVLVVMRILSEGGAAELLDACREAGMLALIEVFDAQDLQRAKQLLSTRRSQQVLLGINNRNLSNLEIDLSRCMQLIGGLPEGVAAVAESGLESPRDVAQMAAGGFRLALVGSALMRSASPQNLIRSMLLAGRTAR